MDTIVFFVPFSEYHCANHCEYHCMNKVPKTDAFTLFDLYVYIVYVVYVVYVFANTSAF